MDGISDSAGSGTRGISARELCLMALLTAVLFLQEELLTFLPNIQLTVLLILLYGKIFGLFRTSLMVTVYLILDGIFMGSPNPLYLFFMWLGWMINPLLVCGTRLKTEERILPLAFAGAGFAFAYCWVMIIPGRILTGVPWKAYLAADLPFEALLAASSFLSILLLYEPLKRLLDRLMKTE